MTRGWGDALARDLVARGRLAPGALRRVPAARRVRGAAAPARRRSRAEERYEARLRAAGLEPAYEPLSLRVELPTGSHRYKPDFLVVAGGAPELHEVKGGYARERDWMRFEMAVERWGWLFTFVWATWDGSAWSERRFERGDT